MARYDDFRQRAAGAYDDFSQKKQRGSAGPDRGPPDPGHDQRLQGALGRAKYGPVDARAAALWEGVPPNQWADRTAHFPPEYQGEIMGELTKGLSGPILDEALSAYAIQGDPGVNAGPGTTAEDIARMLWEEADPADWGEQMSSMNESTRGAVMDVDGMKEAMAAAQPQGIESILAMLRGNSMMPVDEDELDDSTIVEDLEGFDGEVIDEDPILRRKKKPGLDPAFKGPRVIRKGVP